MCRLRTKPHGEPIGTRRPGLRPHERQPASLAGTIREQIDGILCHAPVRRQFTADDAHRVAVDHRMAA